MVHSVLHILASCGAIGLYQGQLTLMNLINSVINHTAQQPSFCGVTQISLVGRSELIK
jgi:hypothetical protein